MRRIRFLLVVVLLLLTLPTPLVRADTGEYVLVVKVMDSDYKAIIERRNGDSYLLEYGVGCLSLWVMEGRQVVINSPGIFAGVGSELIIPDRDETCSIWDSQLVESVPQPAPTPAPTASRLIAVFQVGSKAYATPRADGSTTTIEMDVAPFMENNRTYVPVRFLANALGIQDKNITWTADVNMVTLYKTVASAREGFILASVAVGSNNLYVNTEKKAMDVAPIMRDGRVFLPARYIAEAFGYQVIWDEKNQAVSIWQP